jgi:hypothetical protein
MDNYSNYQGEYDGDTVESYTDEHLSDFKGQGVSSCCGAGTYGELEICEDCGEHCTNEEE